MSPLDELTARCIRCGFCLEACPTFQLTGEETESPRGRIYLIRSADEGVLDWEATRPHMDRCLGCRACETACPSGVEYGQIFEIARHRLEQARTHRTKRALLKGLTDPKSVARQLKLGRLLPGRRIPALLSKLLSGQAAEADKPIAQQQIQNPKSKIANPQGEVYLLEGCVMRVLFPRVHEATRRLLARIGYAVRDVEQGCCGSLHLHAGFVDEARVRAEGLTGQLAGDLPIIVNSAGCGSTMKEFDKVSGQGSAVSEQEASTFSSRVFDASEFLVAHGLLDELKSAPGLQITATYHDACHLAHGQGLRSQPRQLLEAVPGLKLVPLDDADTCCGSAGIYNLTQPKLARLLLERKWANIEKTRASVVAMGNPGCHAWIAQAAREHGSPIKVLHTMELLEAAFTGLEPFA
jgi:glycolate oxidase iron-sulfur subunit